MKKFGYISVLLLVGLLLAGTITSFAQTSKDQNGEAPSKFVTGWVTALGDMSWSELATRIDSFYTNNPERIQYNVFDVIGHEVIAPRMKN